MRGLAVQNLIRAGAPVAAAILMIWPALWNGFPLLYSNDSIDYLASGEVVARALLFGDPSPHYGDRSLIYGLGILPFHGNANPWPVVGLNAALTAYVLWLLVRSIILQRTVSAYLWIVGSLCLLTTLGWYVSFLMPDILGPIGYLSFYLLAYCHSGLSRAERASLVLIAWWGLVSHATHLPISAGLIALITGMFVFQRQPARQWLPRVGGLLGVTLAAMASLIALNQYVYGQPKLFNNSFPFLMVRVVTDPPGQRYLANTCPHDDLAICEFVNELPDEAWEFFWDETGIWQSSPPEMRERLLAEEMTVVRGVVSAYPWEQLRISSGYFLDQLWTFGLSEVARSDSGIPRIIEPILPGAGAEYRESRQMRKTLHEGLFATVEVWWVMISLVFVVLSLMFFRRRWSSQTYALIIVIAYILAGNAAITGVVSQVADRYQGRVIWLLPLFAGLLFLSRPGTDTKSVGTCKSP